LILAAAVPNDKEQRPAQYEHHEDLNDSEDEGLEGPNDSDDDDHLETLSSSKAKTPKSFCVREKGVGSGGVAGGVSADTGFA
jgi:hypothetical protein